MIGCCRSFEEQNVLLRVLTDRGTEYCGNRECHEYQLYLAVENIDHSRTKAKSTQTNGTCERFYRTLQEDFYSVAFRKKVLAAWTNCRLTSMSGCLSTMRSANTQASTAVGKRPGTLSWIPNIWRRRKCSTL